MTWPDLCVCDHPGRGTEWIRRKQEGIGLPAVTVTAVLVRDAAAGTQAGAAGVGDATRFERLRRRLVWDLVVNWVCMGVGQDWREGGR